MKRAITIVLLCTLTVTCRGFSSDNQQSDTTILEAIYRDIDKYIAAAVQHPDSLISASDKLIEFAENPVLKSAVAGYLFNLFSSSSIMGYENIAVHIADKYFLSGILEWQGDGGETLLRLYADFNRSSLIGYDAPQLILNTIKGENLPLLSLKYNYTIIYFFDDKCNACAQMLPRLREVAESTRDLGTCVYAVYTGSDPALLAGFIKEEFGSAEKAEEEFWFFVYDKSSQSSFHKLYNVLRTPQLFLIDRDKKIIGRNLTADSLNELYEREELRINEIYESSKEFVPSYLSIFDLNDTAQFSNIFSPLFERLVSQNKDIYNAVFYHLFEFLSTDDNPNYKDAAVYIADRYIIPYSSLWRDPYYPDVIVAESSERIKANRIGEKAYNIDLYTIKDKRVYLYSIKSKYTLLYFFNPDCPLCKPLTEELIKSYRHLKKKGVTIVGVYAGNYDFEFIEYISEVNPPWPVYRPKDYDFLNLHQRFEVDQVPQTYLLDKNKVILAKRVFANKLTEMFK